MTALEFQARVDAQGPFRCSLEVTSEVIDVSTAAGSQVPNLAWEFVDEAGHYHSFTKSEELPTLQRSVIHHPADEAEVPDDDEEIPDGWDEIIHVCRLCAQPVAPQYVADHSTKVIPGRSFWEATLYGVHLEIGTKVSVAFSTPHDGRVRYFGVADVLANNITSTLQDEVAYVTKLYGDGPLGRKR